MGDPHLLQVGDQRHAVLFFEQPSQIVLVNEEVAGHRFQAVPAIPKAGIVVVRPDTRVEAHALNVQNVLITIPRPLPETKKSMFFASSISCQNVLMHPISSEKVLSISFENVLITIPRPVPESLIFRQ